MKSKWRGCICIPTAVPRPIGVASSELWGKARSRLDWVWAVTSVTSLRLPCQSPRHIDHLDFVVFRDYSRPVDEMAATSCSNLEAWSIMIPIKLWAQHHFYRKNPNKLETGLSSTSWCALLLNIERYTSNPLVQRNFAQTTVRHSAFFWNIKANLTRGWSYKNGTHNFVF